MARVTRVRSDGRISMLSHIALSRNLTAWAEAGVLMLNTCLTVRAHSAGSHQKKGWEQFTDQVVEAVDRYGGANLGEKSGVGQGVVFLAWGAWAAKRVAKLSKVRGSRALDFPPKRRLVPSFVLTSSSPPSPPVPFFFLVCSSLSFRSLHATYCRLTHQWFFSFSPHLVYRDRSGTDQ
jgi:uracil DNA glycosylase